MKKFLSLLLSIMMLVTALSGNLLTISASEAEATLSVSSQKGYAGDTVELTFSIDSVTEANSLGFVIDYDEEVLTFLEITEYGALAEKHLLGGVDYVFDPGENVIAIGLITAEVMCGDIVTASFMINEGAAAGETEVKASKLVVKNGPTNLTAESLAGVVSVIAADEPDVPVTPDEPDEPVNPDEPDVPVTPEEPDEPVTPEEADGVISVSSAKGYIGGTVEVTISVESNVKVNSLGFGIEYDEDVLTFLEVTEYGPVAEKNMFGGTAYVFDTTQETVSVALATAEAISGDVLTLAFEINESAQVGYTEIGLIDEVLKNGSDAYKVASEAGKIRIRKEIPTTGDAVVAFSSANGAPGETVEITASIESSVEADSIAFILDYDKDILTFIEATKYGPVADLFVLGAENVFDPEQMAVIFGTTSKYKFNGDIITLAFEINENAKMGTETEITVEDIIVKNGEDEIASGAKPGTVEVAKKNFDLSFDGAEYTYDGEVKELFVEGEIPEGAKVEYRNNAGTDAGTYEASVTVTKQGYYDYYAEAVLEIYPKKVEITGLKALDKVYDGTVKAEIAEGELSGVVEGDDVYAFIPEEGEFVNENASDSYITVTIDDIILAGDDKDNYSLIQPANLKAKISPVEITVNVTAGQSKVVNEADPAELSYTYEGTLVGNDKFTGALEREEGEAVGFYNILIGTLSLSDNYKITYNGAAFEIMCLLGDINMDGEVNVVDAVLLFRHSMMPGRYPIAYRYNIDFTNNGEINVEDAVLLFRYSMMPGRYPISRY